MKEYIYRAKKISDEFIVVNADSKEEADVLARKKKSESDILDGSMVFVEEREPSYRYKFAIQSTELVGLEIVAHSQEEAKSKIMNMSNQEINGYIDWSFDNAFEEQLEYNKDTLTFVGVESVTVFLDGYKSELIETVDMI